MRRSTRARTPGRGPPAPHPSPAEQAVPCPPARADSLRTGHFPFLAPALSTFLLLFFLLWEHGLGKKQLESSASELTAAAMGHGTHVRTCVDVRALSNTCVTVHVGVHGGGSVCGEVCACENV